MKKKLLIALFVAGILCPNVLFVLFRGRLDTANYENRALAPFPQMGSISDIFAFPASFDAFYNDHVPFKNYFVRLNNKIDRDVFGKTSIGDVTIGTDNWLFYTVSKEGENALADYQRTNLYTQSQCEEIAGRLAAVESLVREKGAAQFKVYIAPNKESVYSQYMPKSVKVYGDEGSRMENFAAYMSENGQEEFVWLKPELMPYADQYQVYYKYDTHLNNLGSFLISQRMAEDLTGKALGLDEVTASQGQVVIGDMSRMINQESTMTDDHDFEINPYYPEVTVEIVQDAAGEEESFRIFESDADNDKTLLLVGDSYRERVEPFLAKLYRRTVVVHIDSFTPDLLDQYQPDDVAVILVERNQRYLEGLDTVFGLHQESEEEQGS